MLKYPYSKVFKGDSVRPNNALSSRLTRTAVPPERPLGLAFLSSDDPKVIYMILEQYPGIFRPLYEKICDMCRNTAEVMSMYSKELAILDKNTVMLMMEEQQATIEELKQAVKALQGAAKNAKA